MPPRAPAASAEPFLFAALCLLLGGVVIAFGPVLTNDGPAHLGMAQAMARAGDPAAPLLNRLYEVNPALSPNWLGHLLLLAFLAVLPPLAAEQALQLLCLLGIPVAARLVLVRIEPGAAWLALFCFPLAMQRMFFLGLYNFSLSLVLALLCLAAWLSLRQRPALWRAVLVGLLALLCFAAQVSGWIAALVALGTLAGIETLRRLGAGEAPRSAFGPLLLLLACLAPGLLLFLGFLGQGEGGMAYGVGPVERLRRVATGEAMATIGRPGTLAALALSLTLGLIWLRGLLVAWRGGRLAAVLPFAALPPAFLLLLMAMPEQAGGGWGHVWRTQCLPYLGLVLAAAALPALPGAARAFAMALSGGGALVAIGMLGWLQATQVPPVLRAFAEAGALIGPHCAVAPVLGEVRLDAANSARITHQPLLHLANRMEFGGDRAVLYNYVARLAVYPVRFRAEADPMRHLFGWPAGHRDLRVLSLAPEAFAASSGISLDYVLAWDVPPAGHAGAFEAVRATLASGFEPIHTGAGGRLELFRRIGPGGCRPG
jgi:hypothetical protein